MPTNSAGSVARHPPGNTFERAVRKHLAGQLDDAERLYRDTLALDPNFPEACNNLGAIVAAQGNVTEALTLFQQACRMAPSYGEALNNAGLVLTRLGQHADAASFFADASASDPARADWANNYANNQVERFQFVEALATFDRAIALQPDNPEFWNGRALALHGLRRPEDAIASLHRSLALDPRGTNALSNLGVLLREQKRLPEAIAAFERALAVAPGNPALLANFASVFELSGDYGRVRELAQRAIAADPDYAESYVLLANCDLEAAEYARCREQLDRALAIDPANRNANWNRAIVSLLHGDFANGWPRFESRKLLQSSLIDHASYDAPEWDGTPLNGRTLLLHTEQGVGDVIQFIRFARQLKARGAGRVVVECPHPIASLLMGIDGVDAVVSRGLPLPPHDVHAFLMSLPFLLGTGADVSGGAVPYISAAPRPAAALIDAPAGVLRIGIAWAGNPAHHRDRLRSIAPERFAPLLAIPNTAWYSLQKGNDVAAALSVLPAGAVTDVGSHLEDLRDTAAVLARLDLVIAVDTAVAHLAGAMGRPTWLLLPHVPDFRWLLERRDSPWYPTMRLFRQPSVHAWDPVFAEVAAALIARDLPLAAAATPASALDEPMTTLESAERLPDGRSRFDLWIPLARLADARSFTAYEAELVAGGHDLALRRFWDEALAVADSFVDAAPGLGCTLMSVLTSTHPLPVIAVEGDAAAGSRFLRLAAAHACAGRLTIEPALTAVAWRGRVALRAESAGAFIAGLAAVDAAGGAASLAIAAASGIAPQEVRASLTSLAARGYAAFEVSLTDGEASLDPIEAWERPQDVVVLSRAALDGLSAPAVATRAPDHAPSPAPHPVSRPGAVRQAASAPARLGIDWEIRSDTGWGVYGTHLALELAARADVAPAVFAADLSETSPVDRWRLQQLPAVSVPVGSPVEFDGVMLRALGNNIAHGPLWDLVRSRRQVGVIFFEDTAFDPLMLDRARGLDRVIAGSQWNASVLQACGLHNVTVVQQGVDSTVFHPAPASGRLGDRFVIFSGGKLEYRKGQDLVIAAFRRFRTRHPEALLLTAWHNHWPQLIDDLALAGHVTGVPELRHGVLQIAPWLEANGVPRDAVLDVGRVPNALMGRVVREAHVALFPNRAEGGTNLVAMECMAAGVPAIVACNTGHLDLVATNGCLPLRRQGAVPAPSRFYRSTDGWGESDVDEIVEVLEHAWSDRDALRATAARGAGTMQGWSWRSQVDRLVTALRPLF